MSVTAQHLPWASVPSEQLNPLLSRQFVSGEQAMVALIKLKKGCVVPMHSHHHEQISSILSGALMFRIGKPGEIVEKVVRAGEVLLLPGHVPHSAEALEDTENLDFFAPPREDWLAGDDAYMRGGGIAGPAGR